MKSAAPNLCPGRENLFGSRHPAVGGPAADPSATAPLVVTFGAIGDLVLMTGFLKVLAEAWGAPVDMVCGRAPAALVYRGLDFVGEIHPMTSRRAPWWIHGSCRRVRRWLRVRPSGPVWSTELRAIRQVERFLVVTALQPRDHCVTAEDVPRGDLEHAGAWLTRLAHRSPTGLGPPPGALPAELPPPRLHLTPQEREDCRRWLAGQGWTGQPVVVLQSQSRSRERGRWPEGRWRATAAEVHRRVPGAWLMFVGSPREGPAVRRLVHDMEIPGVRAACSDLPLRRLFALLELAHSCISLDTGPAHVAAVLGCPTVVLAGRADPRRNHPVGLPGRLQVVTAYGSGPWPASRAEWESAHHVRDIPASRVVAAWDSLDLSPRGTAVTGR